MKKMYLIILCLIVGIVGSNAQSLQVSGVVTDDTGMPVIGASIVVKGTTTGVTSGLDGSFSITAPSSNSVIQFSFIGYDTVELPAQARMDVTLVSGTTIVPDIVVTGLTTMDRRLFSGATDRLAADDIRIDGMADISRGLEGRSAGVSVQNVSATFGTAPKIRVRGATSILGDSKPLWVVDGVILEDVTEVDASTLSSGDAVTMISSAVAGLNADDIESFTILKDGSATSVYGARAMAGVIVITTKRGRAGMAQVNYTGEFTTRLKPNYSEYNIMNSQDQMGIYKELEDKGFLDFAGTFRAQSSGVYGKMYQLMNTIDESTGLHFIANNTAARNDYLRRAEFRNTDWFNELFKNSVMQQHSVSISGGTERSNSYVSLSVMTDPGWYEQSKVSRYTFNANSTYRIRDNLSVTILGNAAYRKQRAPGTVTQSVNAVQGEISRDFDINPFSYALNTSRSLDPNETYTMNYAGFNIKNELQNNYMDFNIIEAKFQGELKWEIIPGLSAGVLSALKYNTTSQKHYIKDNSNQALAYRSLDDATIRERNPWLYRDPDQPNSLKIPVLPEGGYYDKREYSAYSYDFRASMAYNNTFKDDHILNLYGAIELNQIKRSQDYFRGVGTLYDQGELAFFDYLFFKKLSEDNSSYYSLSNTIKRNAAFIFDGTYSYKGKYSIKGTIRYEGTNRMGKNSDARWLPTWNVSAGWNVHEENFFQSWQPAISHLFLRASYSLTADAGPDWISNSTAIINSSTPWRPTAKDRESGLQITQLGNADLTYEKKHEFNVGFDAGFVNSRINLGFDFYTRNNFDLLGITNTQGVGGETRKYANVADMESRGVEFSLSTKNIQLQDFSWTTDLVFSYTKNKITTLQSNPSVMDLLQGTGYSIQGYARGVIFSIPFAGLDSNGLPTFYFGTETVTDPATGQTYEQPHFVDKSNYGDLDFQLRGDEVAEWLKYEGTADPTYTGGFGNMFQYKNWKLNIFMTYAFGNKVRLNPVFSSRYYDLDATPKDFKNRWMMPGDENYTNVPKIANAREVNSIGSIVNAYNAYNYSTERIANGGFIRMKEISLTYDFPQKMVKNWGIGNLSLKFQATNPFLIYSDKKLQGQDPEYYQAGGVSSPLAKQFTLTVRIGF